MKAQMTRLREKYQKDVVPALQKEFGYPSVMAVPKITKVVVNMGLGEATQNVKIVDTGADELGRITGQKPVVRRAKESIADSHPQRRRSAQQRPQIPGPPGRLPPVGDRFSCLEAPRLGFGGFAVSL